MVAERLDRALRAAGIPIGGVSVGSDGDRATWAIRYDPSATTQQQTDGETLRQTFDPQSPTAIDAEKAAWASALDGNPLVQALGQALWEEIQKCQVTAGQTLRNKAQLLGRVKAIYQNLL